MTIAVISDLHDNVAAWRIINRILSERKITTLINCGDTATPAMLKELSRMLDGDIHTVFGNVVDRELETTVARDLPNVTHHGDRGGLELEGRRIGFVHKPEIAQAMAQTGEFNLVCHGHTHLKRWEKIGDCFVLNPGTAGGMFQYPTFAVINLQTMNCEFMSVTL